MKIISADIQSIAVEPSQYPEDLISEIAFVGRSNVGKSSFINAMINRKNLARTSSTPGKTRTINFYIINDEYRFVDLPGYGYARVSHAERDKWAGIINQYLATRENLKEVFLVVDIRHEPSAQDKMMYEWIVSAGFSGYVIATKQDKVSNNVKFKNIALIKKKLQIKDSSLIIPFSSETKSEVNSTWDKLLNIFSETGDEIVDGQFD